MRIIIPLLAILLVIVGAGAVYTVAEPEHALKFQLGKIVRADIQPGLHFKLPIVQNVRKFDRRVLELDAAAERFITVEKKDVIVDSFVKWRIQDPAQYYVATGGDELRARQRLEQIIADGLRGEFAKRTLRDVVSSEREAIMASLRTTANRLVEPLGMEVVDVRIKRIDLPESISDRVYRRMQAERAEVANELRSEGKEAAERIQASADREVEVLLAEARREGAQIRGRGEAQAANIYAAAYERDPEFYEFYRSLEAYNRSLGGSNDVLVLDPESEFFDYFRAPNRSAGAEVEL